MKSGLLKHLSIAFVIALAGYMALWSGYEHLRTRKGPWRVTFATVANSTPRVTITQSGLGIQDVTLLFEGAELVSAVAEETVVFDDPRRKPRFGELIFHDLMFLPGTLTLRFFGHEVELLPRVLIIDRKEHPWESGKIFRLSTDSSAVGLPRPSAGAPVGPTPAPQDLP